MRGFRAEWGHVPVFPHGPAAPPSTRLVRRLLIREPERAILDGKLPQDALEG